jgi:type I restriction-modification system DNA methylase subunit
VTRFERVLTNPPFSQNYHQEGMRYRQRFAFGRAPETGKKADLMFAQHVLSVLEDDGLGAIVMPHGILFRGGYTAKSPLDDNDIGEVKRIVTTFLQLLDTTCGSGRINRTKRPYRQLTG